MSDLSVGGNNISYRKSPGGQNQGIWLLLALLALSAPSATAQAAEPGLETVRVADGVYAFLAPDIPDFYPEGNATAVLSDAGVLVFDTGFLPSTARKVVAGIRRLTDKPVRYVVNSHWHPDHWSGNEVYADAFPGVEIVATADTRRYMQSTGAGFPALWTKFLVSNPRLDRRAVDEAVGVRRTLPTLVYGDELTLFLGGREIRLRSEVGDALSTTVLHLPREKVVATGDLVVLPVPYSNPPPTRWIRSLESLRRMDVAALVPGHGPVQRDLAHVDLELELLRTVVSGAEAALQAGAIGVDEVQAAVTAAALRPRFARGDAALAEEFDALVKSLVREAYLELREGHEWRR